MFQIYCKKQYKTTNFKIISLRYSSSLGLFLEVMLAHFGEVLEMKITPKIVKNWVILNLLGTSGSHLGATRELLGGPWELLGATWEPLGGPWEAAGSHLGDPWSPWEPPGSHSGAF